MGGAGAGLGGCWGPAELFVKLISRALMLGDVHVLFISGRSCNAEGERTACFAYLFYTFPRSALCLFGENPLRLLMSGGSGISAAVPCTQGAPRAGVVSGHGGRKGGASASFGGNSGPTMFSGGGRGGDLSQAPQAHENSDGM